MIKIKNSTQIKQMETSGIIVRDTLNLLRDSIKAGMSTKDLDTIAHNYIVKQGAKPSFLNYNGFPASICVSIDDEIVHGIPSKSRIIQEGSIVSCDVGAYIDGFHADAARTFIVGEVSEEVKQLVATTEQCFFEAIKEFKVGNHIQDISRAVETLANKYHYGVVREMCGHGVGENLHEDPEVANFVSRFGRGAMIEVGMSLAIEPMINLGTREVTFCINGWTVRTKDGKPSSHYENSSVLTDNGVKILTL